MDDSRSGKCVNKHWTNIAHNFPKHYANRLTETEKDLMDMQGNMQRETEREGDREGHRQTEIGRDRHR